MRTDFNIKRAFQWKKERNWDTMYWMIDLHDTVFPGKYASDQAYEIYPYCIEVLQWLSKREDMKIIIWTSSFAKDVERVTQWFKKLDIIFDYYNENPECGNTDYATFETKPYFNILLDDKAGFEGETDWMKIRTVLIELGEWFNWSG